MRNRREKLKKNGNWSDDIMKATIQAIDASIFQIQKANLVFGIPRIILTNWLYGKIRERKRSRDGTLSAAKESLIFSGFASSRTLAGPFRT